MEEIKKDEFSYIEGGINVSGAVINAFTSAIKIVLELGRSLGSAIRRGGSGKMCGI